MTEEEFHVVAHVHILRDRALSGDAVADEDALEVDLGGGGLQVKIRSRLGEDEVR